MALRVAVEGINKVDPTVSAWSLKAEPKGDTVCPSKLQLAARIGGQHVGVQLS